MSKAYFDLRIKITEEEVNAGLKGTYKLRNLPKIVEHLGLFDKQMDGNKVLRKLREVFSRNKEMVFHFERYTILKKYEKKIVGTKREPYNRKKVATD